MTKKIRTVKLQSKLPGFKLKKAKKRFVNPNYNKFFKIIVHTGKINAIKIQTRGSSQKPLKRNYSIQFDVNEFQLKKSRSDNEVIRIKNVISKKTENRMDNLLRVIEKRKTLKKEKEEPKVLDKDVQQFVDKKFSHIKTIKNSKKKIIQTSLHYNDWSKEKTNSVPYYYISTPITKFNEMNIAVNENPFLACYNMEIEDYFKITRFELTENLRSCKVFVYDHKTAIIYKVENIDRAKSPKKKDTFSKLILNNENEFLERKYRRHSTVKLFKEGKQDKVLFIVLNDFFENFSKYEETLNKGLNNFSAFLTKIKIVYFNLPGQEYSTFSKGDTLNNMYYSEFLDKFLFHLSEKGVFDHTYHVILVGFGNGGHIAMTFASCYERYWDFIHSIILFNTYIENDDFMNKSMIEVLKIIETDKSPKLVDFFVKSITVNPKKLFDLNDHVGIQSEGNKLSLNIKLIYFT